MTRSEAETIDWSRYPRVKILYQTTLNAEEFEELARTASGRPTVLFLDEVHRFNKAQQDTFLPYLEDGTLTFIGATTENPSFEVVSALLSRARVYVLKSLTPEGSTSDIAAMPTLAPGRWTCVAGLMSGT